MNFNRIPPVRSVAIRQAAEGQPCTFAIPGICCHDKLTTVLCHLETPGQKGISTKASDINAAFGCFACHNLVDRRDPRWESHKEYFEFYARRAIMRTHHILFEMGILMIQGGGRDDIRPAPGSQR